MFVSVDSVKKENDNRMTKCFDKYGVFFAFGNEQLAKGVAKLNLKEGEKVVSLGHAMFCKAALADDFSNEFSEVCKQNSKSLKEKAGIDNLIRYELSNHECYYTGDIEDAVDALASYDITDIELIRKIFAEEWSKQDD